MCLVYVRYGTGVCSLSAAVSVVRSEMPSEAHTSGRAAVAARPRPMFFRDIVGSATTPTDRTGAP